MRDELQAGRAAASPAPVTYRIDDRDRLVEVGGDWERFARENGGAALTPDRVLGKPLWSFVAGESTRMLLHALIDGVRMTDRSRELVYRCDSPTLRREARMEVRRTDLGDLSFEHRIVSETSISDPPPRAKTSLICCCTLCGRQRHRKEWVEAAPVSGLRPSESFVAYRVCPDCRDRVVRHRPRL